MSPNVWESFSCLDELIQVLYESVSRLVIISAVADDLWTVHVGLVGEGRWWRGAWTEKDILKIVVRKPTLLRTRRQIFNLHI